MSKKVRKMESLLKKSTMSVGAVGSSRQRCSGVEGGRRPYDLMLCSQLPSHEIPLPPSDDDLDKPRSSTVHPSCGSMQDWMRSQSYRQPTTPTYTELLEGRTPTGYHAGLFDLSFGLRSGSGVVVTHTAVVNPVACNNHTQASVMAGGLPDNRCGCSHELTDEQGIVSPKRGGGSTIEVAASRTKTVGVAACRLTTPNEAVDGLQDDDDCSATEVMGRQVWDNRR
ncbi:hypothetical protein CBR_g648 [Chara braunii]|uniref:Uncharacterized protein n=1 Tax=Chara braunii TaxID=69332 RepID=A0A388KBT2_CHABU|nr:hypothetical protein CBR_g648 [Chara braunii]|eukprot:GBG67518.1 hypothetical protein CBR_g648 [Chara braunii]